MFYIGIDPGKSGGIAVLDDDPSLIRVFPLKDTTEDEIARFLRQFRADGICVIESVSSSPQMGVTSAFAFGNSYGVLRGCLAAAGIPRHYERPLKWQTSMKCRTGGDKNVSKRAAQNLYPKLKITHATADALLIAAYCKKEAAELFPHKMPTRTKRRT